MWAFSAEAERRQQQQRPPLRFGTELNFVNSFLDSFNSVVAFALFLFGLFMLAFFCVSLSLSLMCMCVFLFMLSLCLNFIICLPVVGICRSLGSDMARNGTAVIQLASISTSKCPLLPSTAHLSLSLSPPSLQIDRFHLSRFSCTHIISLIASFRLLPLQPTDSGFVLLGDLSVETSTDTDYDDYSMCPPSPCDVEFENANIVIDGKSSIRQKSKDSSVSINNCYYCIIPQC